MSRHPVAGQLVALRLAAGLRQVDIADAVGVSNQTVATWESGQKNPSLANLTAWADALGCQITLAERGAEE